MKIGTLTFQRAENYGAVLQAYALQKYLMSVCDENDVDIIDYRNEAIEWSNRAEHLLQGRKIKGFVVYLLRVGAIKKRNRVFAKFRERKFKLSDSCSEEQFTGLADEYDLIIVGSDQVWNDELIGNDKNFFLAGISESGKKASYAISLGMDKYNEEFFLKHKSEIEDFSFLSMREESGAEYLNMAYERQSEICIDPVFLLGQDSWREFSKEIIHKQKYILCFVLRSDNHEARTISIAKELSRKTGYPIRLLMNQNRFYKFPDLKHISTPSPEGFVSLIDNAEIVVTNSFHATALSVLMHTTFYVDLEVKRNKRIVDLLNMVDLMSNGCRGGKTPDSVDEIDWHLVDQRVEISTEGSKQYLKAMISERKKEIEDNCEQKSQNK